MSETGCIAGVVAVVSFLWRYWEPGITGKETEVETLRETTGGNGNGGFEGDEGF